jgi:transcriptional antiterminator RfaH
MAAACQGPFIHTVGTAANLNWYCVHTKPQKEPQVAAYSADILGVETYFPRLRREKVIRRKRQVITSPLFPRYLFCRFDLGKLYRAVRYAPDVIDIVHAGNAAVAVPDSMIERLKNWAGNEIDIIAVRPGIKLGDLVEITEGPLQGLSGVVLENCEDQERVTLLLSFLQCGAQLKMRRSDVKLIA